jgi:replicative DNA helicase
MSKIQLVQRIISLEANISGTALRSGKLSDDEWMRLHKAVEKMSDAPIYIDDSPGLNAFELRAKCRRLKMQHDIQLIIIDYLQLMSGNSESGKNSGNREQEISAISRALKSIAKELNVPVIALSQLSRAVETRGGNKRPQLSDLRESGAIEQDADIVSFIYRPEYYGITEDDEGNSTKHIGEIIIAKHRNGALETVQLKFINEFAKFMNLDDAAYDSMPFDAFEPVDTPQTNLITRPSRLNTADAGEVPF